MDSTSKCTTLKIRLEQTKAKLDLFQQNPNDPSPIQSLTKETLSGDLLYSAALSYFAAIDTAAQISARSAKVNTVRMPSFGNFGVASQVQFYFGFPRTVGFPGLQMDIDRVSENTVAKDSTSTTRVAFMRALGGQYSAHEHVVPTQLVKDPSLPDNDPTQPQSLSAVKVIAIAASQGQRIYTLKSSNQAIHASTISQFSIDSAVKQEISNALATGKEVTVHQANISYAGFSGAGYIITDPETGAGAYKISGGASGALFLLGEMGAAFSGMLDALLAKYQNPNAMFGSGGKILFAKIANFAGSALAIIGFALGVYQIVTNPNLSTFQQVGQILINLAGTVVATQIGIAVGVFFASPLAAVLLAVAAAILINLLTIWIIDNFLSSSTLGRRLEYA